MLRKKQVVTMVSIAIMSFLMGTTVNLVATASDGNPFDKIWQAIYDLQGRVENIEESINGPSRIEEFINEISRVEFLRMEYLTREEVYLYEYGVSGHWNISKIQTEPIIEKLSSTLSGVASISVYSSQGNPFANQGYEHGIDVMVNRELSEVEIETVRVLIQEYLAKP